MLQRLLPLCEQIRKPFVQRLIALLVSGLIALLLGGAFLLAGHDAFVTHLAQRPVSITTTLTTIGIALRVTFH
jgi:hypothetical protein